MWLLVETLSEVPTVVSEDDRARNFRPLGTYLRTGVRVAALKAVAAVQRSGRPVDVAIADGDAVRAVPVFGPSKRVHAVQLGIGEPDLATRPFAAAYEWIVGEPGRPLRSFWTDDFQRMYGVEQRRSIATPFGLADVFQRVPGLAEVTKAMRGVYDPTPGDSFVNEFLARHDDGSDHLIRSVRRIITVEGRTLIRGVDQDVTARLDPWEATYAAVDHDALRLSLDRSDRYAAMLDLRHGGVMTWIGSGSPEVPRAVASGIEPLLHPVDVERIRADVAAGRPVSTEVSLHLRDGWETVHVQLDRMIGHGPTVVCLLIASRASGQAGRNSGAPHLDRD
ncbi:GAF domain-containing protein [Tsukamurella ocularis]|uniref:GAF domain-containing protein n=1 Tax=Tsukamurella ocularis TaxID=1970234 RepID=UPI0021685E2D|nr:GAF domain-containing protein [Tsukamurella ocularis]MCS3780007.1 hypothetical protein [Tsukamurella ocularis]MCS3788593.1 hypothetical protein [Tsukamurella ocularis]MCS3849803.1 hypothetical protein [Tsukamurella ocularis]